MKSLKMVFIAVIFSFAVMNVSAADPVRAERSVKISLEKALTIRSLTLQMYHQIPKSILAEEKPGLYFGKVRYNGTLYLVYGKYLEWVDFFNRRKSGECGLTYPLEL